MPVDAEPVDVNHGGGNVLLTSSPAGPLAQVVSNPADLFGARAVYRSHFATCPYAARHRRSRRSGAS